MTENLEHKINKYMDENPSQVKEILSFYIKNLIDKDVAVVKEWRRENMNAIEADCISQCNFQMAICTAESILSLAKGINWTQYNSTFIDINACACLVRSLYERAFIYRNIFITPSNKLERDLLLYIWEIRGINNRVNLKDIEEKYANIQENDKDSIIQLKRKAFKIAEELSITENVMKQINNAINSTTSTIRGLLFEKEDAKIVNLKSIHLEESPKYYFKDKSLESAYTYLSFTTHPSYLGVIQFGQRYNDRKDEKELNFIFLTLTFHLLSEISIDFCKGTSNAEKYLELIYPYTQNYFTENKF